MKILLIGDDSILIKELIKNLILHRYVLDVVQDVEMGWTYGSTFDYDLILLDITLPKIDGVSLCKRFRSEGFATPILLLSDQGTPAAKVYGLDSGADDYIVKPFENSELFARIRSLLRRSSSSPLPILAWGDLLLNLSTYEVSYNGQPLALSTMEYELLELLLRDSQHVFSTDEIIDRLWSLEQFPSEATVRSHIRRVRQKLVASGAPKDFISTVHGRGYYLKTPQIADSPVFLPFAVKNSSPQLSWSGSSQNNTTRSSSQLQDQYYSLVIMVVSPDLQMNQALIRYSKLCGIHLQIFQVLTRQAVLASLDLSSDVSPRYPDAILFELPSQLKLQVLSGSKADKSSDFLEIWDVFKEKYPDVPRLVMAEHLELSDRLQLMQWGGDCLMEMKTTPDEVIETISRFLVRFNISGKVMVVDIDQDWLYTVETLLKPWGFKVTTLADVQQVWTVLEAVLPDALVLDINFPKIDGFEICKLLRRDPSWCQLPILFLSDSTDPEIQTQAFRAGADDYLNKSMMALELPHRIMNRLQRRVGA
ncbi:MAG: response regulator [Thermosynechococcaceae cyanobacterium]